MKKNILTSVVASTVLAGILAMSGCGGDNNSCCGGKDVFKDANVAKAEGKVGVGSKLELKTPSDSVTSIIKFNKIANSSGTVPSCVATKNCNTTVTQELSCPKKPVVKPILQYDPCYGRAALVHAEDKKDKLNYDKTKQMIVYGGIIVIESDDFDTADVTLDVAGLDCGLELRTEVGAGFSNPGHKVFAMVRVINGCSSSTVQKWTDEVTIDENNHFTLDIKDLDLSDDGQVEILLFSIKDADKSGSTGAGDY